MRGRLEETPREARGERGAGGKVVRAIRCFERAPERGTGREVEGERPRRQVGEIREQGVTALFGAKASVEAQHRLARETRNPDGPTWTLRFLVLGERAGRDAVRRDATRT